MRVASKRAPGCRGGSRGTPDNCVGEHSNYLLRKAIFALLHRYSTNFKSASAADQTGLKALQPHSLVKAISWMKI